MLICTYLDFVYKLFDSDFSWLPEIQLIGNQIRFSFIVRDNLPHIFLGCASKR